MKNGKYFFAFILLLFSFYSVSGIDFTNLSVSADNRLLLMAESESQRTVYLSSLTDMSVQQLTSFPERLHLIDNGRSILSVNRFGVTRIPMSGGLPSFIEGFPSLKEGNLPLPGRLHELSASYDGRWILYIEPVSPAYGNLYLFNVLNGVKQLVSERVELPAGDFPAKWSPDSRLFFYIKGGSLYYCPVQTNLSMMTDETYRMIGQGGINSIYPGQRGDFYYLKENILYRLINSELYTRTIYSDFLPAGNIEAVLPFDFNPGFDRFWIAPDSGSILIDKNGRNFFVFLLGENQHAANVLPSVSIPQGAKKPEVLWSQDCLLIISSRQNQSVTWRFEIKGNRVTQLSGSGSPISSNGTLSPDGTKAVFWGERGLELWDFKNWRLIQSLSSETVYHCLWVNDTHLVSGNGRVIRETDISGSFPINRAICLSSADETGFETGSSRILARIGESWYATDGKIPWSVVSSPQMQQPALSNERYRVFLEPHFSGHFKNIPMVRSISSANTVPLISSDVSGVHSASLQAALCFDLYEDDTGLHQVLGALERYGIKATFFLNGNFIRRNPESAAAIIRAGHETASLFYAPLDFFDSRYRITPDFIKSGLARNADEFLSVTGSELSLIWHPPYFRNADFITAAAADAGYRTAVRTLDPGDWLTIEEAARLNIRYITASEIIEQIIARKANGAVIPVRLGLLSGGRRDEYLFQRIDVLIEAMIRAGIEIVPVSEIIR